ncbi:MAG TPA: glycosyltransferase family A protein [Steroidobacteraceae bacterium]
MISAITCTGDRPIPLGFCVEYMARQTRKPDQWIIVDDGRVPLDFEMQQRLETCGVGEVDIIRRAPRSSDPPHTLCVNLLAALDRVSNPSVAFIEDDDWYSRRHIEILDAELMAHDMFGYQGIVYYHVGKRCHKTMGEASPHASLCQTGITSKVVPTLKRICASLDTGFFVDLRLWREFAGKKKLAKNQNTVVGIKGLPGRQGLTAGWRSVVGYMPDPAMKFLESLVGGDIGNYILPASHGPSHDAVRQPNSSGGSFVV